MQQPIVGFFEDDEPAWVAELACGHRQHVRHDPPWTNRAWTTSVAGRAGALGQALDCRKCEQAAPPDWVRAAPPMAPTGAADPECAFIHSRTLAAPRERVWRALCEPALLARWWGPAGFTNTFERFDFAPGGLWRFTMHAPDGKDYGNESVFAAVTAPARLIFDHVLGHHFTMTITLDAVDAGTTRIGWQQVFDSAAERERIAAFVVPANEQNLDRLAALVATLAAEPPSMPL